MFPETQFVLNCSRISLRGGLGTFTAEIMKTIVEAGYRCQAVVPDGFSVPDGIGVIRTPVSLAGASDISVLRPVKWLLYSYFEFPVPGTQRIFCTTHHVLPGRSRQIVTVHDLRPYFLPDNPAQGFYFQHMLPRALRKCDGVVTVSETSRQILADVYKLPLDRIAVVPNVVELPAMETTLSTSAFDASFLLVVGASWPHKNVESLLRVHPMWASRYALCIVAGEGQYSQMLQKMAKDLGIEDRVNFLTNVPADALRHLYQTCAAVIAPSRMEGFGLPALEGMAYRRPVIAADIPVFRELYGKHPIYVETESSDSWAAAFSALSKISAKQLDDARVHAASFSHSRMVDALCGVFHQFWGL
jgi:glycosyltransferase involved in cell wall biosynthesis